MRKSIFTNRAFYWAVIILIGALLSWNIFLALAYSKFLGIIPIAVQATLLYLVWSKHEYAKNGLKTWAVVFLIIGPSLKLFGGLLSDIAQSTVLENLESYLVNAVSILIGIAIVDFTNKTVKV
ncbi:hypothetical protein GU926_11770 [Nibribacter ruber]|uniref:Uncharacterized protein n=1 Tax=Nibribacter ruber TaxID=2698458 RepID=A0A6P1P0X7_9BACT|nr:hypothetical protein [Nibribacter ruber]QHL88071.1 hypothetical protein GU926_11770 [Nibribacter ruber]